MNTAYPIILSPSSNGGFLVYIPDFNLNTEGKDIADAMFMARDVIGLMGIDMQDDNEKLPSPSNIQDLNHQSSDIITMIDINFDDYRRKHDNRVVKKNCTLPSWLNEIATERGINFSQVLQDGLKATLHL